MAGGLEKKKKVKITSRESSIKPLGQILKGYELSLYLLRALEDRLYQIKVLFFF